MDGATAGPGSRLHRDARPSSRTTGGRGRTTETGREPRARARGARANWTGRYGLTWVGPPAGSGVRSRPGWVFAHPVGPSAWRYPSIVARLPDMIGGYAQPIQRQYGLGQMWEGPRSRCFL